MCQYSTRNLLTMLASRETPSSLGGDRSRMAGRTMPEAAAMNLSSYLIGRGSAGPIWLLMIR